MGIKRAIRRLNPINNYKDLYNNIKEEGSVFKGIMRWEKEGWIEDPLIISQIYGMGKKDGKRDGYNKASEEYNHKLLDQAEKFLKERQDFVKERKEYEDLLDSYAKEIEQLEGKVNKTQIEIEYLRKLLLMERKLKNINMT